MYCDVNLEMGEKDIQIQLNHLSKNIDSHLHEAYLNHV